MAKLERPGAELASEEPVIVMNRPEVIRAFDNGQVRYLSIPPDNTEDVSRLDFQARLEGEGDLVAIGYPWASDSQDRSGESMTTDKGRITLGTKVGAYSQCGIYEFTLEEPKSKGGRPRKEEEVAE